MCTLIAAFQQSREWPLVVAANRDEHLDRASTGLQRWPTTPAMIAPRDEVAGGTWLGLNAHGLFVAVTNRFGPPRDDARRSRGELVTKALQHRTSDDVHHALSSLAPDVYNAFHLFYADADRAYVTWSDTRSLHQLQLSPGLHIVTERSVDDEPSARASYVHAAWPKRAPGFDELAAVLRHHGATPLDGTCVHAPDYRYGTRSSFLLLRARALEDSRIQVAEGHPCEAAFQDASALVRELVASRWPPLT